MSNDCPEEGESWKSQTENKAWFGKTIQSVSVLGDSSHEGNSLQVHVWVIPRGGLSPSSASVSNQSFRATGFAGIR